MVMTEWRMEINKALETIPKGTPNRLKAAIKKAKLTYKKGHSSSHHASAAPHSMKKSHKRGRGRGRGRSSKSRKGMRRSKKHYKGGAMSKLNPADYDGKGVGTSGFGVQIEATTKST